jgi:uncharacterized protein (UPF0548 family)
MMLSLRKPSAEYTRRFLTVQARLEFSYSAGGATADQLTAGFVVDRIRIKLGEGEPVFQAAKGALQRWRQFDLGWMEAWSPETPIQTGEIVAIVARAIGLWSLNACKIVYVLDESGPISKFGFASGTLTDHAGDEKWRLMTSPRRCAMPHTKGAIASNPARRRMVPTITALRPRN